MEDWLLYADVVRTCGHETRFRAVARKAYASTGPSIWATIQWSRVLCMKGETLKAYHLLRSLEVEGPPHRLVRSLLASSLSQIGCREKYLIPAAEAEALDDGSVVDGMIAYELCYAGLCARHWERALAWGQKALHFLPQWPRLRVMLAGCYLSMGQDERARAVVLEILETGIEDAPTESYHLFLNYAGRNWGELIPLLEEYKHRWSLDRDLHGVLPMMILANVFKGDLETARSLATKHSDWAESLAKGQASGRTKILPVPSLVQEHDLCVPTSVALVAGSQGIEYNPRELYQEMKGHEGAALWRMVEVMEARGLSRFCRSA